MKNRFLSSVLLCIIFLANCSKDPGDNNWTISDYTGTYKNIEFAESLIKEFSPGIYTDTDIPEDIKHLTHGRIEIDFRYDGGALNSFMPLFYYGSINKNDNDNALEEPAFNLVVEVGHYNVIPLPVEYLFYTISTYHQPQYCRDTYWPVMAGVNYTFIIDKKPEGIVLHLMEGQNLVNVCPHAFFPDSSLMFFKDVTSYIDMNKGDTLKKVLMVGSGFAGFSKGLHELNGIVTSLRIYKYTLKDSSPEYELTGIRNQQTENQLANYNVRDNFYGNDKYIKLKYEFWPYKFESGVLVPNGDMQSGESNKMPNNQSQAYLIKHSDIGFYKLYPQTLDEDGNILSSGTKTFDIWVYPKEWDFEFYP